MLGKLIGMFIWLVLVPLGMGLAVYSIGKQKEIQLHKKLMAGFCSGYVLMWAVFQLVAVPFILKQGKLRDVELWFEMIALSVAIMGYLFTFLQVRQGMKNLNPGNWGKRLTDYIKSEKISLIIWAIFALTLLLQLYMSFRLAYADGDDAYYISISTAANLGGSMYQLDPYTGAPTTLDIRHGLAPFPIWVSFIALKAGVNAAVAAHSFIPLVLIPLTYVIYLEIGKCLVDKKYLPVFMVFISLLQIFGNYSIYPASTFLLTRTRQGKAALGNVILPFLILLLLKIAKKQGKAERMDILWLFTTVLAGCLCSTMSGFLSSMLIMLAAFLLAVFYKKPRIIPECLLGCTPGILYAVLYIFLK